MLKFLLIFCFICCFSCEDSQNLAIQKNDEKNLVNNNDINNNKINQNKSDDVDIVDVVDDDYDDVIEDNLLLPPVVSVFYPQYSKHSSSSTGNSDKCDCNDGIYCNGVETCDNNNECVPGIDPCNDGIYCNGVETCDNNSGCAPGINPCDDGIYCNGVETCDNNNECVPGINPCNDNIICTVDECFEAMKSCGNLADDALCHDGSNCHSLDVCDPSLGCISGVSQLCNDNIPCTIDGCSEETQACTHSPNDSLCDNNIFCDGAEVCNTTLGCQSFTGDVCDDFSDCIDNICNEESDSCSQVLIADQCGNVCAGEYCDLGIYGGCSQHEPPCPDDGIACTDTECSQDSAGQIICLHVPNERNCSGLGNCSIPTCSPSSCTPPCDGCVVVPNDQLCQDDFACTLDSCDPVTGNCVYTADISVCQRPASETNCVASCELNIGCVDPCDDGLSCTFDQCDESNRCIRHIVSDCSVDPDCSETQTCPTFCNTANGPVFQYGVCGPIDCVPTCPQ